MTEAEIQCANEAIAHSIGVESLNSYGITVYNPDDSLLPEDFAGQRAAVDAVPRVRQRRCCSSIS